MSGRCVACNAVLKDREIFLRKLPDGTQVWEDMCSDCRNKTYGSSDSDLDELLRAYSVLSKELSDD